MLQAWLFGPLRASVDADEVPPIAGLKPRAVFAWLLMHPGLHPRAAVAARFWPDVLDTSARASLRSALWVVRAALAAAGGASYLTGDRAYVGLDDASGLDVDLRHAARLAAGDDPAGWDRAFAVMAEPLLSDLTDDWVLEARDEYRLLAAELARRLAADAEHRGQLTEAITWTRRALARDRLDEATHRLLIARLAEAGEPAQALVAFERCRTVFRAEFGTVPSDETRALARAVRADAMTQLPPRARADPPVRPPTGMLVGRDAQLAELRRAWQRASAGDAIVAVVTGAAGIGKSRLVDELAVATDRALVCRGTCAEIDGSPPFAPWSEAFDAIAGLAPPPASEAWPSELARLSTRIQQSWHRAPAGPAATPELERLRLFDAVLECLRWAAGHRPLLLILEDVHLVDAASAALILHVARRLAGCPVLVVLTMRPEGPATPLDPLERADPPPERIVLEALDRAHASALVDLVAPGLPPAARDEVIARGEGNPLLIVEAARARRQGTDVAEGLRGWLRPTLARLPGSARLLVDVASVAGRPLELGEVASCVGPDQMDDAVDAACAAGFLQERPGRRLGFVHALIRDACYAELGSGRRIWAHGRLAQVLQGRPQSEASELARHLLLTGQDERARDLFARAAADARAVGALDEAAGFLREAAALADRTPALAAELSLELASIEAWRAGRPAVDEAFTRGIALLEEIGDRKALASAWGHHALLLWTTLCYPREAAAAYQRCLRLLGESTDAPEIRVLALAGQAKAEALIGDPARAAELADAVAARILPSEDPALAAEMAGARLIIALRTEPGAPSLALADRAMQLARDAGRIELVYVTAITTSSALAAHGDIQGALAYADRALASGRAGASLTTQAYAARAYALVRLGRPGQARAAVGDLLEVAADAVDPDVQAIAAFDAGAIALMQDRPTEAIDHLECALAHRGGRLQRPLGRMYLAEAYLGAGDVERAAGALARVPFEPVGPADMPATLVPRLCRLQGLIAAARGDRELADRRLAEAEAGWDRLLGTVDIGSAYATVVVDLGRPPVGGLVEVAQELARVRAERRHVASTDDPGRLPVGSRR
jgi:DNA-binding SARP family transcriptional activator/tetratricopeptide (TPR) repeat protein